MPINIPIFFVTVMELNNVLDLSQNTTILNGCGTYVSTTCLGQYIGHRQAVLNL
jgi:hypothetical protein